MAGAVRVRGLADLNRALARTSKDVRLGIRKELRQVGEPVADEAESLALARIRSMPRSPQWADMRVGVTTNLVYVVPRQRGTKTPSRKRTNLAGLLMDRAMQPALDHHQDEVERDLERMLGRVTNDFSDGGF